DEEIGLRDRILARAEELVRPADDPGPARHAPVARELRIVESYAVADPGERELLSRGGGRAPDDRALVGRDVEVLHGPGARAKGQTLDVFGDAAGGRRPASTHE